MSVPSDYYAILFIFGYFVACLFLFVIFYRWAKKRKATAVALCMLFHAFIPVPNADTAVQQVVEKKQHRRKEDGQHNSDDHESIAKGLQHSEKETL